LPARATAAPRGIVAEEKERRVVEGAGVEEAVGKNAKVVVGKSRRRATARVRRRRRGWGVDGGILSVCVVERGEGG